MRVKLNALNLNTIPQKKKESPFFEWWYKVVPPSYVCWFINPMNTIVISMINPRYCSYKPSMLKTFRVIFLACVDDFWKNLAFPICQWCWTPVFNFMKWYPHMWRGYIYLHVSRKPKKNIGEFPKWLFLISLFVMMKIFWLWTWISIQNPQPLQQISIQHPFQPTSQVVSAPVDGASLAELRCRWRPCWGHLIGDFWDNKMGVWKIFAAGIQIIWYNMWFSWDISEITY